MENYHLLEEIQARNYVFQINLVVTKSTPTDAFDDLEYAHLMSTVIYFTDFEDSARFDCKIDDMIEQNYYITNPYYLVRKGKYLEALRDSWGFHQLGEIIHMFPLPHQVIYHYRAENYEEMERIAIICKNDPDLVNEALEEIETASHGGSDMFWIFAEYCDFTSADHHFNLLEDTDDFVEEDFYYWKKADELAKFISFCDLRNTATSLLSIPFPPALKEKISKGDNPFYLKKGELRFRSSKKSARF
tara:strand:- start:502 stop:1239 length:738 start_codon:yes stop_codon:yes gene_type:complete